MKRLILSALVASFLALGATSDAAIAKTHTKVKHTKHHAVVHKAVVRKRKTVKHVHHGMMRRTAADRMMTMPEGNVTSEALTNPLGMDPESIHPMGVVVHPGDCDIDCMVDVGALSMDDTTGMTPMAVLPAPEKTLASSFRESSDTIAADYRYVPPKVVTVGGFDVPVTGNPYYYSIFKHRDGEPMPVHNHKGMDATRGYGISPRADNPPTSFGPGYQATAEPEQ